MGIYMVVMVAALMLWTMSAVCAPSAARATAQVSLRAASGCQTIQIRIPSFNAVAVAATGGMFTVLGLDDCGWTDVVGEPQLPVIRRLLVAPDGAQVSADEHAVPRLLTGKEIGAMDPVLPRQRPEPKVRGVNAAVGFAMDRAAYAADRWFPAQRTRVVEAGTYAGRRLVLVEFAPIQYNPAKGMFLVAQDAEIEVKMDGGRGAIAPLSSREDAMLASVAMNHHMQKTAESRRLLVIAHDAFVGNLAGYVVHKAAMGWTMVVTNKTAAGSTAGAIQSFIRGQYTNVATRPDMVLLVGDVGQVPCFTGMSADSPDTDLYYGCMDGGDDWQPELSVGRISVNSATQLDAVLAKTMAYETNMPAAWTMRAVFMASEDRYWVTEATHNWVIDTYMAPVGYESDKLYCHTYGATGDEVTDAFNAGRALGVYSGHGNEYMWADGPYFPQSNVNALTNANTYPLVLSFACLTGRISINECFAETWLRGEGSGAVNVWASSVNSYWDEDDILERKLFTVIFDQNTPVIGDAVLGAKYQFLQYYGVGYYMTRNYFEQYNLLGDPTVVCARQPLAIMTSSPLPTGFTGEVYQSALDAHGGKPPYTNWAVVSGDLPSGLMLEATSGIISGFGAEVTNAVFAVRLADAAGSVCTAVFELAMLARLKTVPGIEWSTPTNLPLAVEGEPYTVALQAQGGAAPYSWTMPPNEAYIESALSRKWIAPGQTKPYHEKNTTWRYVLPWSFPFYGEPRTELWISSNGFIDFGTNSPDAVPSVALLSARQRIAPFWLELDLTAPGNGISIKAPRNGNYVAICWKAHTIPALIPVEFEVVLYPSGEVRFNYRRAYAGAPPTIGLSKGDGLFYTLAAANGSTSMAGPIGSSFTHISTYPPGLSLTNGNMLAGTPLVTGKYDVIMMLSDAGAFQQHVTNRLVLDVVPEPFMILPFFFMLIARRYD